MTVTTNRSDSPPGGQLIEREDDLARLSEAIESARDGRGGIQMIEGPPGIGKSSLLAAAGEAAARLELGCLRARSTEIEGELLYGALRQLLEGHLRGLGGAERDRLLSGAAAPAATALGLSDEPVTEIEAINGLFWLAATLAADRPQVWLLDDFQWADRGSARFLAFAMPRLAELPIAVFVAKRSGPDGAVPTLALTASDPGAKPISPRQLSLQACSDLAERMLPAPLPGQLSRACHRVSGGNPFYLTALLERLVAESDASEPAELEAAVMTSAPPAVARLLVARIAALGEPAAAVAKAVAVLGEDAGIGLVKALSGTVPDSLAEAIDRLAMAAIFAEAEPPRFICPMVRNAVYGDLRQAERDRLHRRAAELLAADGAAPESVGEQLMATRPSGDDSTVGMLRDAAAAAAGSGAQTAAVRYLCRALAEPPSSQLRQIVSLELARAELATDGAAARERLRGALATAEPGPERVAIVRSLTAAYHQVGELGSPVELLRAEIPRAGGPGSAAAMPLEADLAMTLLTGLDGASMREAHERVERLAPELTGQSPAERALLSCLAYSRLCRGLPAEEALAPVRLRFANASDQGPEALPGPDWVMGTGVLLRCGELKLAERIARQGLKAARAAGSLYGLAAAEWALGATLAAAGQLRDAAPPLDNSLRATRDFGAQTGVHTVLVALVEVAVERGQPATALAEFKAEGLDQGADAGVATMGMLLESRAGLRLALGEPEAALEDYDWVARFAQERDDLGPGMTRWRLGAARTRMRMGQAAKARELAGEELERARRFGAPALLGQTLVVAGQAEGGRPGIELLEEAVELLADTPCRVEYARALIELGASLRRSGKRAAARKPLSDGLKLARAGEAVPLAERAFEELRASGAHPRKVLRTGLDALTASEHRVAVLAASGMSNREIAQELFISPRTVEFHLRQIFAKLGASSRTELPALMTKDDGPPGPKP